MAKDRHLSSVCVVCRRDSPPWGMVTDRVRDRHADPPERHNPTGRRRVCATCHRIAWTLRQREWITQHTGRAVRYDTLRYHDRKTLLKCLTGFACRRCGDDRDDALLFHHVGGGGRADYGTPTKGDNRGGHLALEIMYDRERAERGSVVTLCGWCHALANQEEARGVYHDYTSPPVRRKGVYA